MILADTSGLLALFNRREPRHHEVRTALEGYADPLVVSPYVVAEVDYLIASRLGVVAELAALRALAGPRYDLAHLTEADFHTAADVVERYADQAIGIADASIVVLASRYRTERVLTLDRRHIEVLRDEHGRPFALLP